MKAMRNPSFNRLLRTGFLTLGICVLLAAALYLKNSGKPTPGTASAPKAPDSSQAASSYLKVANPQVAAPGTGAQNGGDANTDLSRLKFANRWNRETKPAFAPFNAWVNRYLNAPAASRPAMIPEGETLAGARRKAMEDLIQSDPKEAIDSTVPANILPQLPLLVLNQIEKRVSGRGNYEVNVVCFSLTKQKPAGEEQDSVTRRVVFNDQTLKAFAYGRRLLDGCKYNIPLQGISIGSLIALHDSPVRVLESGEVPAAGGRVVTAPIPSSGAYRIRIQVGDFQIPSIAVSQALQIEADLIRAEAKPGPYVRPQGLAAQLFPALVSAVVQPWTTGTQRVLIIRVDFSDFPGDPVGLSAAQDIMDTQVKPFYEEGSFHRDTIVSTITTKTYRMPSSGRAYATAPLVYTPDDPFHDLSDRKLHSDAETAASQDGYDLTQFDRIGVVFPALYNIPGSIMDYGGLADIGGPRFWVNGVLDFDERVVPHELGHTYGLFHANLWQVRDGNPISPNGSTEEYGDDYDNMGELAQRSLPGFHPDFGPSRKVFLNWIDPQAIVSATASGVFRIYRFDDGGGDPANHTMAVTAARNDGRSYWISYRTHNVTETIPGSNLPAAAYILWRDDVDGIEYRYAGYTNLLDLNTPGSNLDDAGLNVGTSFSDPSAGITITPLGIGGSAPNEYLDVQVSIFNSVGFIKPIYDAQQADGSVPVVVRRTGDGVGNLNVSYSTVNGTAKSPGDYLGAAGSLSWGDGDLSDRTITLNLRPGQFVNGMTSFSVKLTNAVGGFIKNDTTTVQIHAPGSLNPNFAPPTQIADGTGLTVDSSGNVIIPDSGAGIDFSGSFVVSSGSLDFLGGATISSSHLRGGLNGNVNSVIIQPDGKVLVAGGFSAIALKGNATLTGTSASTNDVVTVSGFLTISGTAPGIVRLNNDGSIDSSFDPGSGIPNPAVTPVKAMVLQPDGKVMIAGNFTSVQGTARTRIARLDSDGTLDLTFDPDRGQSGQPDAAVLSMAVQPDARIVIGGVFQNVGGASRPFAARLDADGSVDSSFVTPVLTGTGYANGAVECIAVQPNGAIVLGGSFASGTTNGIVRLLTSGSLDANFNPGIGATYVASGVIAASVKALGIQRDGSIVVGGNFNTFNGAPHSRVARLNLDGSIDATYVALVDAGSGPGSEVRTIALDLDGKALIGGEFTRVSSKTTNQVANRVARLNTNGTLDLSFYLGTGISNTVNSLSLAGDGSLVLGNSVNPSAPGDPVIQGTTDSAVALFFGQGAPGAGQIQLDSDTYTGFAGGSVQVLVQRTGGAHGAVSVNYSTVDGTAVAGTDYVASSGTLAWAEGDLSPRFLAINFTGTANNQFYINLGIPIGGVQLGSPAWATVNAQVGNRSPIKPVNLLPVDGATLQPAGVTLTASPFSDPDGDFHLASQWLIFRDSDGALVYNSGQSFFSNLTSITTTLTLGTKYQWRVRYFDLRGAWSPYSDPTSFTTHPVVVVKFAAPSYSVAENIAQLPAPLPGELDQRLLNVVVTRNVEATGTHSVQYATRSATAQDGVSYNGIFGTLTFTGTENSKVISIPIIDNYYPNGNTQFFVDLSYPTGGATLPNPSVLVTIQDNELASFSHFVGNYYGLIGSNPPRNENAGFISMVMNRNGLFTASIQYGAATYRMTGQLGPYGHFSGLIPKTSLTLNLDLDVSGNDSFSGSITDGGTTDTVTADRSLFDAVRFPAPQRGAYTFLIRPDPQTQGDGVPQGAGYGTINVDGNGKGRLSGVLGDGTKVTQSLYISKKGTAPFYALLYKNQGSISGALQFRDLPLISDVDGNLAWFKPPIGDKIFPFGFVARPRFMGSRYVAPPKGTRVLPYLHGIDFIITHGALSPLLAPKVLSWGTDNKVFGFGLEPFKMSIAPSTGLFSGSFKDQGTGKMKNYNGALLQKPEIGAGYFLGNGGTTGEVEVLEHHPEL